MVRGRPSHMIRGELHSNRHPAGQRTTGLPSEIPVFEIGRFVLPKHATPAEARAHPLTNFVDGVLEMNGLANDNPEDIFKYIVNPHRMILRYMSGAMFEERYDDLVRRQGIKNNSARHHRANMRSIKRHFSDTLAEQERLDALAQRTMLQRKVEHGAANGYEAALLDKFSARYNDDFEVVQFPLDDPGAFNLAGPALLALSKRVSVDEQAISLRVSRNSAFNCDTLENDVDRINIALSECDLISGRLGELSLDDLTLDIPVVDLQTTHTQPEEILMPLTPFNAIPFQSLGIHEMTDTV